MMSILLTNMYFQMSAAKRNLVNRVATMVSQVEVILERNQESYSGMTGTMKENCLSAARIVAYMIKNHPEIETDVEKLKEIAEIARVSEIHLFNEQGVIYSGTLPKYFGLSFESGEQIGFFKQMLYDKNLELSQELMLNTAEKKYMMYAAVWMENEKSIVQIGMEPSYIIEAMEKNQTNYIFSLLPSEKEETIYAVSKETGIIVGSTDVNKVGMPANSIHLTIPKDTVGNSGFSAKIDGKTSYCAFFEYGDLYIGIVKSTDALYSRLPNSMLMILLYLAVATAALVGVLMWIIDRFVINNVKTLNRKLKLITAGNLGVRADVDNTPEFKSVSENINRMVDSLLKSTEKISKIFDEIDTMVGMYEYNNDMNEVLVTRKLGSLLTISASDMEDLTENRKAFIEKIEEICSEPVEEYPHVYKLNTFGECYLKIQRFINENGGYGVVFDVTDEIVEKLRLQKERDFDLLTDLLSRRAFYAKLDKLFMDKSPFKHAAMLMFDLDGLKYINDNFGHISGDRAIKEAADVIKSIQAPQRLVSRLGGDEFAVFIYGAESREEIDGYIEELFKYMKKAHIVVYDEKIPIRLSMGYICYPDYDLDYTDFLRYADKAMYYSKRNGKSLFTEYDESMYDIV